LAELERTHNVELNWHSFELRPKGGPPIPPEYRAKIEASRPQLYATAREQYGVEMNPGPFGLDSRPALIAVKYAEEMGKGNAFHEAVLNAYWLEARDIEDRTVLREIGETIGLDADALIDAIEDPNYIEQVDADINLARTYGLQGVPALIFEQKYLIPGAVPVATLQAAVEQVQQERAQ
jgi:predicted DsbA family dithiol-disulfide isomerase